MPETDSVRRLRPNLTLQILVGVVLGLAWGVFFGDYLPWGKWIGNVYVGLLQMAVLPYVMISLVGNIGRLSMGEGSRLARATITILSVLWGIGLMILALMTLTFPEWKSGSFFSTSLIQPPARQDWLELFVPYNPFWSLANNMVPAVVVFSLGLGVALMRVPNKQSLIAQLDVLVDGLSQLNRMVVRLAPIGVFGIVADAAGTLSWEQFGLLQAYLLVYGAASLLVSLWLLPAVVACCTPFSQREVLSASRDLLITAFVIGNTFVLLPMIIEAVKRLMERRQLTVEATSHLPDYVVPLAYPLPDIGRIVGLLFVPFAAWFYGQQISPAAYPQLVAVGFVGAFAKPVVTMPLLLDLAHLPNDIFVLYVAMGTIDSRLSDLMKVMHLVTFALLSASVLTGVARIDVRKLLVRLAVTVLFLAVTIVSLRGGLAASLGSSNAAQEVMASRELLHNPVSAVVLPESAPNPTPLLEGEDRMQRIRRRGILRVGFDDRLPFAYQNGQGELVGFDIDLAHQMARDLKVSIEFVPFDSDVIEPLRADQFDIAMSGLEGTMRRATELPHVEPYMDVTTAFVVPDYLRGEFRSLAEVAAHRELRLGVISNSAGWDLSLDEYPNLRIVPLESAREFFESDPPVADALVTSAEVGAAWTLKYPEYTVVKPTDIDTRIPLYYFVEKESQFEEFLENWLELKERDGTIERLYDYWILGREDHKTTPRWSIIRNVLHWAE